MNNKKNYAVFGLGRYGSAVAKELCANGAEVLAVDINGELVNNAAEDIPYCKCADVTDAETIRQLGISNFDVVIISMATNLEASVMATMLCKEAGVESVIAKCSSEMNCRILKKVGADRVIFKNEWINKSLKELNLRKKYSINIVAVIENDRIDVNIDPEKPLRKEMSLIVIADKAGLAKLR